HRVPVTPSAEPAQQFLASIFGHILFSIVNGPVNGVNVMSDFVKQNLCKFNRASDRNTKVPRPQRPHNVIYIQPDGSGSRACCMVVGPHELRLIGVSWIAAKSFPALVTRKPRLIRQDN